tara:strand:- start:424 stop:702 length:279 start_codon:yes stop_codon:yes gene_type:complete
MSWEDTIRKEKYICDNGVEWDMMTGCLEAAEAAKLDAITNVFMALGITTISISAFLSLEEEEQQELIDTLIQELKPLPSRLPKRDKQEGYVG